MYVVYKYATLHISEMNNLVLESTQLKPDSPDNFRVTSVVRPQTSGSHLTRHSYSLDYSVYTTPRRTVGQYTALRGLINEAGERGEASYIDER